MSLEVIVASASNLPNLESFGKIDPYVSIEYQGNHVRMGVNDTLCRPISHTSRMHFVIFILSSFYHISLCIKAMYTVVTFWT